MKTFSIYVTEKLTGYSSGSLCVKAGSEQVALKRAKKMSKKSIDKKVDWSHYGELDDEDFESDFSTIKIDEDSIDEINNKTFEIEVTQKLTYFASGTIFVKASNEKDALQKLKKMSKERISLEVDWNDNGPYVEENFISEPSTVEIDEDSIYEV